MWQKDGFALDKGVGLFSVFLESETYMEWAQAQNEAEHHSITLADAIQGWMEVGGGIKLFTSYTSFLLGVLNIIDEWTMMMDCKKIVDAYVDPINRKGVQLFQTIEVEDPDSIPFQYMFTFVGKTEFHPIMQQNWFEMLQARSRRTT